MDKKRIVFLDVLRIIAALFIIAYHILINCANNDPSITIETLSKIKALSSMMQWHIRIFFMITGFLWLNDNRICTYSKVLSNIRRFILVLLSFGFGYAILERVFYTRTISANTLLIAFSDIFTGDLWDHMWYLYTIIGVYLLLPLIKPFFDKQSKKYIQICSGILFLFVMIIPITEYFLGYSFPIDFPIITPVFYVCIGGLITKVKVPSKMNTIIALIIFFMSGVTIYITGYYNILGNKLLPMLIFISTISLFITIYGQFSNKDNIPWIKDISLCTFGIYVIHPLFINILIRFFNVSPIQKNPIISFITVWLVVASLSYFTTYMLRKITFIRKYIL